VGNCFVSFILGKFGINCNELMFNFTFCFNGKINLQLILCVVSHIIFWHGLGVGNCQIPKSLGGKFAVNFKKIPKVLSMVIGL
jgi:hypothetical protein